MELSNQLFLASSKLLDGQFGVIKQVVIFRLKDRSQFGLKIEKKKSKMYTINIFLSKSRVHGSFGVSNQAGV